MRGPASPASIDADNHEAINPENTEFMAGQIPAIRGRLPVMAVSRQPPKLPKSRVRRGA